MFFYLKNSEIYSLFLSCLTECIDGFPRGHGAFLPRENEAFPRIVKRFVKQMKNHK